MENGEEVEEKREKRKGRFTLYTLRVTRQSECADVTEIVASLGSGWHFEGPGTWSKSYCDCAGAGV